MRKRTLLLATVLLIVGLVGGASTDQAAADCQGQVCIDCVGKVCTNVAYPAFCACASDENPDGGWYCIAGGGSCYIIW